MEIGLFSPSGKKFHFIGSIPTEAIVDASSISYHLRTESGEI